MLLFLAPYSTFVPLWTCFLELSFVLLHTSFTLTWEIVKYAYYKYLFLTQAHNSQDPTLSLVFTSLKQLCFLATFTIHSNLQQLHIQSLSRTHFLCVILILSLCKQQWATIWVKRATWMRKQACLGDRILIGNQQEIGKWGAAHLGFLGSLTSLPLNLLRILQKEWRTRYARSLWRDLYIEIRHPQEDRNQQGYLLILIGQLLSRIALSSCTLRFLDRIHQPKHPVKTLYMFLETVMITYVAPTL